MAANTLSILRPSVQYLCNKHGLEEYYPSDPGKRAMVDSAVREFVASVKS